MGPTCHQNMNDEWWQASQTTVGAWSCTHDPVVCGPASCPLDHDNWTRQSAVWNWQFNWFLFLYLLFIWSQFTTYFNLIDMIKSFSPGPLYSRNVQSQHRLLRRQTNSINGMDLVAGFQKRGPEHLISVGEGPRLSSVNWLVHWRVKEHDKCRPDHHYNRCGK